MGTELHHTFEKEIEEEDVPETHNPISSDKRPGRRM
jgi:hypothetical protein